MGGFFGDLMEGGKDGAQGVFVPWYQQILGFKKYSGKPKWYMPLIYFLIFSAVGLFSFYIYKFMLQR